MPDRRFDAVVFDFGGVIISPITRTIDTVAADLGVEGATLAALVMGPFDVSGDHPWHRLERGELDVADLQGEVAALAAREGLTLRGDEIDRILAPGVFDVHHEVLACVADLRADGYRTGLLTNSIVAFRPTLEEIVPRELFDAYVDSSEIGCRKPEAAAFEHLLEALGRPDPGRVLYLDDFAGNLAGARAAGLATLHVHDPHVALAELHALLAST